MPKIADEAIARAAIGAGFNAIPITSRTPAVIMTAIALSESSGNTSAVNHVEDGMYGLWQINKRAHKNIFNENWEDPNVNAKMAKSIFDNEGYGAWSVYGKGFGVYRTNLPKAIIAVQKATIDNAPAPKIPNPIPKIPNPLADLQKLIDFVGDRQNWIRAGLFTVGGILLVVGIFKITGDNQISQGTKELAKTVAMRGLNKVKP